MAGIDLDSIQMINKGHYHVHDKVDASYSIFMVDGKKYVQIDMYGRSDRDIPGKISQTIQLDKESALFIMQLLKQQFDI